MSTSIWLAELIGTFALVFVGIAVLASGADSLTVALAFGLTVAVMIAAVGPLSLAHFNPAVSLGFLVMRRIDWKGFLAYCSAELLGALAGLAALQALYGTERLASVRFGATVLAPQVSLWQGFGLEFLLTFFLMFVIASCVIQKQPVAGLYIGFTVVLGALAAGALTGASMNPARSFAPALFAMVWSDHWLYWLAPMTGAALAAITATYLWSADLKGQS